MAKISVYEKNETSFVHNGIVLPDVVSCTIEEELNGKYVLELTHPIDEEGKWGNLAEENIIKADGQLFRIHSTEKNLEYVYVYARHIFYDLLHNFLEDVRPTNLNGTAALNWILTGTQYPHYFIGMSDIDSLNTQYFIRKNPVEAMLGEDSLVTRWNGELVRDNYTIKLLASRGTNKGAHIAYGKNLLGLEVQKNMDSVITRIMPVGTNGLLLPEKYVDSPLISNYVFPKINTINFNIGIDENTTEAQAFDLMRQACNNLYTINKVDIPYININADLLMLENTEEYKHIENLVKVGLGDIVSCTDNPLNINFESKVIRIKKDVLSNRNVEVELGKFKQGISNTIDNAIKDISEELQHSTSNLQKAINDATELLTNALGGYVVKRPGEILIMDTEDINTATQVWRWNLNGLGYSSTGINGPYELAMTMDGKINANFITTGVLSANLIKAGVLSSHDNSMYINLDNNSFNFNNKLYWDGNEGTLRLVSPDIPNIESLQEDFAPRVFGNGLMEISDTEGFVAYKDSTKQEFTQLYPDGLYRVFIDGTTQNKKPYFFERHVAIVGDYTNKSYVYGTDEPEFYTPTDAVVEADLGAYNIVQLPSNFIGKNFRIVAQMYFGDGTYMSEYMKSASQGGSTIRKTVLQIEDMNGNQWDGVNLATMPIAIKNTGQFRIKGWFKRDYYWVTYVSPRTIIEGLSYTSKFKILVDVIA